MSPARYSYMHYLIVAVSIILVAGCGKVEKAAPLTAEVVELPAILERAIYVHQNAGKTQIEQMHVFPIDARRARIERYQMNYPKEGANLTFEYTIEVTGERAKSGDPIYRNDGGMCGIFHYKADAKTLYLGDPDSRLIDTEDPQYNCPQRLDITEFWERIL